MRQHKEDEEQAEDAKMRMIYDCENVSLNLSKIGATDVKGNSRVILPRKFNNFDIE